MIISLVPRPHPLWGEGMARILGCADSAVMLLGNPIRLLLYIIVLTMDECVTWKCECESSAHLCLVSKPITHCRGWWAGNEIVYRARPFFHRLPTPIGSSTKLSSGMLLILCSLLATNHRSLVSLQPRALSTYALIGCRSFKSASSLVNSNLARMMTLLDLFCEYIEQVKVVVGKLHTK